jgi:hypothetical protein
MTRPDPQPAPPGPASEPVPESLVPRGSGALAGAPELAQAFRANAEAIRAVHETQAEMVRALKRQDRSEIMLQSTQALNETFRNLALVQRRLLERLESPPPGPTGSRLVPLMLIGLLVVFLGGST